MGYHGRQWNRGWRLPPARTPDHHNRLRLSNGNHGHFGTSQPESTQRISGRPGKKFSDIEDGISAAGERARLSGEIARPFPRARKPARLFETGAVTIRAPQARKPAPDARLGQMKTRERQSACKPGSVWLRDRSRNVTAIPLGRASLRASSNQPGRPGPETGPSPLARAASSLFGFAPGGACRAVPVAGSAVRSYRTFSPLPVAEAAGGSISVALSLGSPPPDVIRHRVSVEPGLSSPKETEFSGSGRPADWRGGHARWGRPRQARRARKRPKAQLRAVIVRTLAQ